MDLTDICAAQFVAIVMLLAGNIAWYCHHRASKDDVGWWQRLYQERCRRVEKLEGRLFRLVAGLQKLLGGEDGQEH